MRISKRELLLKIARAREIAKECHKKYGGSFYSFLSGAYEGVFAELLGIDDFDGKYPWIFDCLPTKKQASRIVAESCFTSFDAAKTCKGMVKNVV